MKQDVGGTSSSTARRKRLTSQPTASSHRSTLSDGLHVETPTDIAPSEQSPDLAAIRQHAIPDLPSDDRFVQIARLASTYFRAPIALVSLIDQDRHWVQACVGLRVCEVPHEWAFLNHAIRQAPHSVLVAEDATADPRCSGNPPILGDSPVRFCAGAVLTAADGNSLGTLCVIDTEARPRPSDADLEFLASLAKLVVDQLELSKAREVLDEQRRLLKNVEAMAGVGHWHFDLASQVVRWSDEVYRIHGLPLSEQVPAYEQIQQLYHEDDRATLTRAVDRAIEHGEEYALQLRIRRPDGLIRHTMARGECTTDSTGKTTSIFGVFQDVTDQHLAAAALADRERHYRLLADNVRDVIAVYSTDGVFRYISPSVMNLLGYSASELLGQTPFSYIHADDCARVTEEFKAAAAAQTDATIEYRALTKDGHIRWLEAKPRFHRDAAGEIVEISDSVRDVTDRYLREAALHQAKLDAEIANKAKATFLANMSHEIRTPMNGVVGFAELLADSDLDEEQSRHVELIADSGRLMMRLLNDILDISKIEARQMQLTHEHVDIRRKMHGIAQLMEPAAAAKAISLRVRIDDGVPEAIVADSLRLRQILLNLVGNAVKFTERGQIVLSATMEGVGASAKLRLDVSDTGIGIAADRLESIFETFSQADPSIARTFGGTGLGLSIARQLATLMGGHILVTSEPGKGSVFSVLLPLRSIDADPVPSDLKGTRPPAQCATSPTQKTRILLAEDHDINQELMIGIAKKLGVEITIAADGAQVIAMVDAAAAAGTMYDFVLMDVQMPDIDGLEASRRLRSSGFTPEMLPIIALTANACTEDVAACLAAGMQAHLCKPVRVGDLRAVIDRFANAASPLESGAAAGHTEPAIEVQKPSIEDRYRDRKAQTLDMVAKLAVSDDLVDEDYDQVIDLLHKLAGTAGMFGEIALGNAASELEHALAGVGKECRQQVIRDGWRRMTGIAKAAPGAGQSAPARQVSTEKAMPRQNTTIEISKSV